MSKFSRVIFAAAIAVVGLSVYADGGWIFDSTAKTLTCGDNVIKNVTVKNGTSKTLTIGDNRSNADIVQLDLTLPIADRDGVAYTIDIAAGSIGNWQGNKTIQTLVLPQPGCNSIQWDMFKNCTAMTSVEIVEGTTTIGANSFNGCTSLSSLTIPSTITSIGSAAFQSAAIKSIVVPGAMETVNAGFVPECAQLESFVVSMGCKTFGAGNFFKKTTSLKYVEFPSTLEQVTGTDWFDYAYNPCDVIWPVFPKKGFAAKNCPYGGHDNNNTKTNYIHWSSRQDWIDYSATNAYGIVFNMPATYDGLGSWVGSHTHVIKYYVPNGGVVPWETSFVKEQSGDFTVGVTVANVAGKVYAKATCEGESDVIAPISVSLGVGETATATLSASSLTPGKSYEVTVYGESADGEVVLGNFAGYAGSTAPTDKNYWTNASGDGLASTSANWSRGTPVVGDDIVIDGKWCNADLTWDLPSVANVASWEQTAQYTGTVTMPTEFPNKGSFPLFTVTGAMTVAGGTITHPQSRKQSESASDYLQDLKDNETYRINFSVGSLFIGKNAKIDVTNKGYYHSNSGSHVSPLPSHGGMFATGTLPYDDPKEPIHIGMPYKRSSGAYTVGIGGGAVYIVCSGAAVINGSICADTGSDQWNRGYTLRAGGAGGSVYLRAESVSGTGSISASALSTAEQNNKGCGGRVAVVSTSSTPVASTLSLAASVYPFKSNGTSECDTHGSAGTVYTKDATQTYGTLIVDNVAKMPSWSVGRPTTIPSADGDWTFDCVKVGHNAILSIPVGTTINLANGFSSGASANAADETNIGTIRYEGGTLGLGSTVDQSLTGRWCFTAWTNYVFSGNVSVAGGAVIGVTGVSNPIDQNSELPTYVTCSFTVNGNLTVASDGSVSVAGAGLKKYNNTLNSGHKGVLPGHTHGGRVFAYKAKDEQLRMYTGYDSIFLPSLPGVAVPWPNGQSAESSGGVLILDVKGQLTVDGCISANGMLETYGAGGNCSGGCGGTLNITAGSLAGVGEIRADAGSKEVIRGSAGRIAIRLTEGDFSDYTGVFSASGRVRGNSSYDSSAGTVYLQTAAEGDKCGTIRIAQRQSANSAKDSTAWYAAVTATTEMVSIDYEGDSLDDYKNVKYEIDSYAHAAVNANITARSIVLVDATSKLDLEGHTLTVKSAKLGDTTLAAGTYHAGDAVLGDFVADSVGGGLLVVQSATKPGLKLIIR